MYFRKNKFGAIKTIVEGITFASKKEARRYVELKLLEKQCKISHLRLQPAYVLQDGFQRKGKAVRAIKYIADFEYKQGGEVIVEDTKGVETDVFKLKRKMFWFKYPGLELRVF